MTAARSTSATASVEALVARARIRAGRALAAGTTMVVLGVVGAVAFAVASAHHSAWRGTIRDTGRRTTAVVRAVSEHTGRDGTRSADVELAIDGGRAVVALSGAAVDRYRRGATVEVWYDAARPERFATAWDVADDGVADAQGFAAAMSGVAAFAGLLVVRNRGLASALLRWAPAGEVKATVRRRSYGRSVRTTVTLPDEVDAWAAWREPGTMRTGRLVVVGSGHWIVVCPPWGGGPCLLRRARTRWTARRWRQGARV